MTDAGGAGDPAAVAARWRRWARWARDEAQRLTDQGDTFTAALVIARGAVRADAADLLCDAGDPAEAALAMHLTVRSVWLAEAPLIGYDAAAITYTEARTWQACARELDPALPTTQPRWD